MVIPKIIRLKGYSQRPKLSGKIGIGPYRLIGCLGTLDGTETRITELCMEITSVNNPFKVHGVIHTPWELLFWAVQTFCPSKLQKTAAK